MLRSLTVFLVVATLSGCLTVQFGEPYDKVIDDELNSFQKSTAEFLKSMQQNSGNAKSSYGSDESKKYYASSSASLSNMMLRASLLSDRECPSQRVAKIATPALTPSVERLDRAEAGLGISSSNNEGTFAGMNCSTVAIWSLQETHKNLEADHREYGRLSAGVAQLNGLSIDQSVRVALTTVRANK
ncbi:hypothetical protein [Hoeflea poritis]|uniref:Lipoprotein n=1 Tax=Hoeflea poritis TaxID=2993659 RepID=A0ABT4VMA0_9HYPH|nr:hypothetical protein [Hoeflea poritis]MDA4845832.1 hypothetical protein [Hoeflea poritis]